MDLLKYFDAYTRIGLRVIPLYPASKVPVGTNWNQDYNPDAARRLFAARPDLNIGLLLGPVVDVEGDTAEANDLLRRATHHVPHPMYQSAKSVHHLFLNPNRRLTLVKQNGVEFRGYLHQSALPPSVHEDGSEYRWLAGTKFPIPPLPASLLSLLRPKAVLKPGHVQPWCSACGRQKFIHGKRYKLEVEAFRRLNSKWQCRKCRKVDVRPMCREIRRKIINRLCVSKNG